MSDATDSPELATGFPPVIGPSPRILVLGSLPSVASIEAGQYYAKPQNAFWKIMGALCAAGPELDYADRLAALEQAGVALWDVLHAARRPGSLDSAIVLATEQVNDITGLLERETTIRLVALNGEKAAAVFRRHVSGALPRADIDCVTLPSTSPAYASLKPKQKLERWREVLAPHLQAD